MVIAAPLGTEFTYQGVLSDAGSLASGDFDFRLFLYNADAGGSQVGPMVLIEDVTVTDGRFTTQLDFGDVFDGAALWLEVGVRDGALGGTYTVLQPRQELTAAPFAQHAKAADSATTAGYAAAAGEADTLDGQHGAYYLSWSNFTGIPGDLADGDDDTLSDLSCTSDEIARWNGSAWNCSTDDDTPYSRTFVLGPVGTPTQNGTALRNAIAAITPPTSQEEAVLLMIEPGVYDVGDTGIEIHGWTMLEGAGRDHTKITGTVCDTGSGIGAGLVFSDSERSGLGRLALVNTCGGGPGTYSIALGVWGAGMEVRDARLEATGAAWWNHTCVVRSSDLVVRHTEIRAENGSYNEAINSSASDALFENVNCDAIGGESAFAFRQWGGGDVKLRSSTLQASSGTSYNRAFYSESCSGILLEGVVADAGSHVAAVGITFFEGDGELVDVRARGYRALSIDSGGPFKLWDVVADGVLVGLDSQSVQVNVFSGWISGGTNSVVLSTGTLTLEGVILAGGPVAGPATCTACMRNGTFSASGCP